MSLMQLEVFCSVYKERSFSRAAECLGLAQPTVSLHIKAFEAELGAPLFNRLGREIVPTAAGDFLYAQALPLLTQNRKLSESMTAFLNRVEGPLVVGTSSAAGELLLPGYLLAFRAKHPAVEIKLRFFSNSSKTLEELRAGSIDIGITAINEAQPDVAMEPFGTDELILITPTSGPWKTASTVSVSKLKHLPLIVLAPGSASRASLEKALAAVNIRLTDLNVVAELGRTGAVKQAVRGGFGVAFISKHTIASELSEGTLRTATVPELVSVVLPLSIVHDQRRDLSPTARAFLEHLRQSVKVLASANGRSPRKNAQSKA